jgi:hypothetical protein
MKFGIALGRLHPSFHREATLLAESLGFESVWMAEHLVFPLSFVGSPHAGEDVPPVPPSTPVYDAFAWLAHLAALTERIRLGTDVYLLGLRHPFVAARAVQTLDLLSAKNGLLRASIRRREAGVSMKRSKSAASCGGTRRSSTTATSTTSSR